MCKKLGRIASLLLTVPLAGGPGLAMAANPPAGAAAQPNAQPAPRQYTDTEKSDARVFLAEQFCEMAYNLVAGQNRVGPAMEQSAALLQAAMVLNPLEPRYPRLLVEARAAM